MGKVFKLVYKGDDLNAIVSGPYENAEEAKAEILKHRLEMYDHFHDTRDSWLNFDVIEVNDEYQTKQ